MTTKTFGNKSRNKKLNFFKGICADFANLSPPTLIPQENSDDVELLHGNLAAQRSGANAGCISSLTRAGGRPCRAHQGRFGRAVYGGGSRRHSERAWARTPQVSFFALARNLSPCLCPALVQTTWAPDWIRCLRFSFAPPSPTISPLTKTKGRSRQRQRHMRKASRRRPRRKQRRRHRQTRRRTARRRRRRQRHVT
jgi:hypothetical protein